MATSNFYTSKTVYFFTVQYPKGHSLLKLDIPVPENEEGDWKLSSLEIIRHFHCDDASGRNRMGCGKFGSKLYILGGVCRNKNSQGEIVHDFPRDVMVFDPAAPDPSSDASLMSSKVSPMNSGKLNPLMFEVGGKLYVLGSVPRFVIGEPLGLEVFEEYNPETNQWKVLEGPPIEDKTYGSGYSFVLDSSTVIIQGDSTTTLFIFNPKTYVWTKLDLLQLFMLPLGYHPLFLKDFVYGAQGCGIFTKMGPISLANGVDELLHANLSKDVPTMDWGGHDSDSLPNPWRSSPLCANSPMMCHLGDWRFCLLESSSGLADSNVPNLFEITFDVYIHKIIQHDQGCLRAKCLHAATFTINTGSVHVGQLMYSHVMSNEMQRVTWSEKFDGPKRRKIQEI